MSLGAVITRKPVTVGPEESLAKVARLMEQENVGAVVVTQQNRPVGIITDRDVALNLCLHGAQPRDPVQKFMTSAVDTIGDDQGIYNATMKMMELAVRRLPVVDEDGVLVGIVGLDDLLALLSRELRNIAEGVRAEVGVL
jgi:CBS domain-containing protein